MEIQKEMRAIPSSSQNPGLRFEDQLKGVIMHHLEMLSQDGKEKVLDFINGVIDLEEKRLEFNRRQGLLYNWTSDDTKI